MAAVKDQMNAGFLVFRISPSTSHEKSNCKTQWGTGTAAQACLQCSVCCRFPGVRGEKSVLSSCVRKSLPQLGGAPLPGRYPAIQCWWDLNLTPPVCFCCAVFPFTSTASSSLVLHINEEQETRRRAEMCFHTQVATPACAKCSLGYEDGVGEWCPVESRKSGPK